MTAPLPDKPALRARIKRELLALSPAERAALSARTCDHLSRLLAERVPPRLAVMLFAPMLSAGEVDIAPLALDLLRLGRPVCIPRPDWPTRSMHPVEIHDWSNDVVPDLVNARLGLRAPRQDLPELPLASLGAVVVPGLAFDPSTGTRLGRGGGFYDRFLPRLLPHTLTIGLAFNLQLLSPIPTDPHDARVHCLITESGPSIPLP
jgi:5-formyltetrahydrofolate cyclo-ligase